MARRTITLAVAGFLAGMVIALIVLRSMDSAEVVSQTSSIETGREPSHIGINSGHGTEPAGVAAFRQEVRSKASGNPVSPPGDEAVPEAVKRLERLRVHAQQEGTQRLLDAGFSQDRIDFLRHRRDVLQLQRKQADFERSQMGLGRDPFSDASARDEDLVLRSEMNEGEYIRYRQALGKPIAITVSNVGTGSYAEQAGIKPGDQLLRYGDKRVFDNLELTALAASDPSAGFAMVEVLRNGQNLRLSLRKGPTGLRSSN